VDPRWHGKMERWRAHQSLASGRSGARKLADGDVKWSAERRELGAGLTGARAALRRLADGGAERGSGGAR
jgi:hypothetical protein